ncbi:MAG: 23S rRNA (uracil(1939)-C(5))-methyltransferase RlmD [Anaerolineae bacterium]|nr:23S rRNA (uracil(1939)-C(5))-methyltransferase RlmD [Anaerolineae bacterium]
MSAKEITLTLHDMAHGGEAVGYAEGKAIFVPLAIPGETVRVQIVQEHKRWARGHLVQVLEVSPQRTPPPCPYFGLCGGCHWQHIDYQAQLHYKTEIVRHQLERIGKQKSPPVQPTIGMADPWAYRNHIQLAYAPEGALGYYALRSYELIPINECLIAHPLLNELRAALEVDFEGIERISLRAGVATGEQMVILEGGRELPALEVDMPVSCVFWSEAGELFVLAGSSYYHERLLERTFRISAPSFFQVNTSQAERMIEIIAQYLELQPYETLLDAYCGVGTFALTLGLSAAHIWGIESSPWAIADAQANDPDQVVEFIEGDIAQVLADSPIRCDAIVLDPPRTGCTPQALEALARCQASRIVYVSCDPATLARDIATLTQWGYSLSQVQPIDMFPQTYHIETIALLRRRS